MSETTPGIEQRLALVRSRIEDAAARVGRDPAEIRLVAASKTFDASALRQALAAGQVDFGENYVQEALDKMGELGDLPLVWHFIGPIQSNKTRAIAEHFDWVHSVDRLKIAERLSSQRPASIPPLDICLEVNISGEASKGGVAAVDLPALAQAVAGLPRLRLRGLMAIPAPSTDPAEQRAAFATVRQLYETLRAQGLELDTLSMGMSGDLEAAIAEGATMVRVGTALFGERVYA
jgi:PLP dependent protein